MRRVGHADLQGRAAYHPYFITYPDGRVIALVGTHSSTMPSVPPATIDSNLPKPNLEAAQTSILYMSPDQGGHTSFPVFGLAPKSYGDFTEFQTRDIVILASESTADLCDEAPGSTSSNCTARRSRSASASESRTPLSMMCRRIRRWARRPSGTLQ